jgi:hypothetical protein
MLASDAEIREKREADFADKTNQDRIAEALCHLSGEQELSWWRRQSKTFRAWTFFSIVWASGSWLYILLFDPFELESWRWVDERDIVKILLIIFAPVVIGLIKAAYDRIVK